MWHQSSKITDQMREKIHFCPEAMGTNYLNANEHGDIWLISDFKMI